MTANGLSKGRECNLSVAGQGHNWGCGRAGRVYNGHIMVALNEKASELGRRLVVRGCRVTAAYQGGTGIAAGDVGCPGAAAQSRYLGTGFRAADGTNNFGLSLNALGFNGADTYQFVVSNPVGYLDPSGDIAWYYWVGAGAVDVLGGGPEDPISDIADGAILGAGEAAARAAAQQAMEQSLADSTAKAASIAARLALLHAMAAAKDDSGPKANTGASGGSCPVPGSPQKPGRDPEKWRQQYNKMRREPPPEETGYKSPEGWNGQKVGSARGYGWPDENGNVWVPDNHGGQGQPHWDVQLPGGNYYKVPPPADY